MKRSRRRFASRAMGGFALIEALVAVLLFAVGIIALLRVLGTAIKDAGDVQYRAVAATLADSTIGRMWVDRPNWNGYVVVDDPVPELPNGLQTVAVAGNVVTITIRWQPPGAADERVHTVAATLVTN